MSEQDASVDVIFTCDYISISRVNPCYILFLSVPQHKIRIGFYRFLQNRKIRSQSACCMFILE